MTLDNQNFTMNNGDDYTVQITNFNQTGGKYDLRGASIVWTFHTPKPIVKSTSDVIGVSNNILTFPLNSSETDGLSGSYKHECKLVDVFGKHSTLCTGIGTII